MGQSKAAGLKTQTFKTVARFLDAKGNKSNAFFKKNEAIFPTASTIRENPQKQNIISRIKQQNENEFFAQFYTKIAWYSPPTKDIFFKS